MKLHFIILTFALALSSCYTYKTFDPEEYATELANQSNPDQVVAQSKKLSREEIIAERKAKATSNQKKIESETLASNESVISANDSKPKIDISTIKMTDIVKPDQFYKVDFEGKQYTIEAKQWKSDTLYAVVKGTEKELKFHQKDISDLKIRKFSKGKSDALTIAAYALGGVGIFLLLK